MYFFGRLISDVVTFEILKNIFNWNIIIFLKTCLNERVLAIQFKKFLCSKFYKNFYSM